jgi:hypothetical protein
MALSLAFCAIFADSLSLRTLFLFSCHASLVTLDGEVFTWDWSALEPDAVEMEMGPKRYAGAPAETLLADLSFKHALYVAPSE